MSNMTSARRPALLFSSLCLCASVVSPAFADVDAAKVRELRDAVAPSLVPVQYTYDGEVGRQELTGLGTVVSDDGLVAVSIYFTPQQVPDSQLKDFKIIIPGQGDADERKLDAVFQGRDERSELAFVKVAADAAGEYDWRPVTLSDESVQAGEQLVSVGRLPEYAGYLPYVTEPVVSAVLRGPVPQVLVTGDGLAAVGSVVLNTAGEVVGLVHFQQGQVPLLNLPNDAMDAQTDPPRFYVPASFYELGIGNPPTPDQPLQISDLGVRQSTGLNKDVAAYYGVEGKPAVQVGDVIKGSAADRAGVKSGDVIVSYNGEPLERGDQPDELPQILGRTIERTPVGTEITLGVLRGKDEPVEDVKVTLAERPTPANKSERFFAEDLGFTARQPAFEDYYDRKLDPETTQGLVVAFVKRDGNADTGGLRPGDFVQQLNQQPVETLEGFKEQYEAFREERPREAVVLEVLRGVNTQIVRIEPPQ